MQKTYRKKKKGRPNNRNASDPSTVCVNRDCKLRKEKGCRGFEGCPGFQGK